MDQSSRREFLKTGCALAGGLALPGVVGAAMSTQPRASSSSSQPEARAAVQGQGTGVGGKRPNILFLMTDQMQGAALEEGHPAVTPNFDRLAKRGVRVARAYTPCPICSPARASLMTGLLPHAHGVLDVTHVVDADQSCLRTEHPHWAQALAAAGYYNGYFGKWHVERSERLEKFGWHVAGTDESQMLKEAVARDLRPATRVFAQKTLENPGYRPAPFYQVTDQDPRHQPVGLIASLAEAFLQEAMKRDQPWCCFASCNEPHDPYVCGKAAFDLYDVEKLPLPPTLGGPAANQPNIYRKSSRTHAHLSEHDHRMAAACYYGSISEVDQQYGRLLDLLEKSGQMENTIVVLTSDHGELLGAHGLYCKNIGAFEGAYHVPMLIAGPGVARGQVAEARVGLHDLGPTLCELAGVAWKDNSHSQSFGALLRDPAARAGEFATGYAEYFGSYARLTQRVVWDGAWKLVFNGFDFDELYNLQDDPHEMRNRIDDPACAEVVQRMFARMWSNVHRTNDRLKNMHYQAMRVAPYGPLMRE